MGYGRLVSEHGNSTGSSRRQILPDPSNNNNSTSNSRFCKLKPLLIFSAVLLIASAIAAAILVVTLRTGASGDTVFHKKPTASISRTCRKTQFPNLCVDSLLNFPGATTASDKDLVHISVNMTLQRFNKAYYDVNDFSNVIMDVSLRSAYDDCLELLSDSVELLANSLSLTTSDNTGSTSAFSSTQDVMTWLSAALTNQDTCVEGFSEVVNINGDGGGLRAKNQVSEKIKNLSELVSNCLAIYSASNGNDDFSGVPIGNRRRLLEKLSVKKEHENFPHWFSRKDRKLLDMPVTSIQADIVVSKDGSGTVKTIAEAIKKAPERSDRRIIIYVRAGRYEEQNLKVGKKKTNLMFIGDGKGKTVISGGSSVSDKVTTFHTASFAATGSGFIARDITFENWAGPQKHQAVALRVGADHAVVYRCSIIGYQDTLYVHSNRQFYRECDVYGTVDFIFGNAAVVFQNCNLYARKPMNMQKNTITAQNRKDPNQNTGISIHACKIIATPDLEASKGSIPTYLGRPWKMYSRTVYMMSSIGDHVHPRGWLEWNGAFALDTLYYAEYMNNGPGAALGQRVKWPGYHVLKTATEASQFTVGKFIYGSSWLPSTGVAFMAGLSN